MLDDKVHESRRNTWQQKKGLVILRHPATRPSCSHMLEASGQPVAEWIGEKNKRQLLYLNR